MLTDAFWGAAGSYLRLLFVTSSSPIRIPGTGTGAQAATGPARLWHRIIMMMGLGSESWLSGTPAACPVNVQSRVLSF